MAPVGAGHARESGERKETLQSGTIAFAGMARSYKSVVRFDKKWGI